MGLIQGHLWFPASSSSCSSKSPDMFVSHFSTLHHPHPSSCQIPRYYSTEPRVPNQMQHVDSHRIKFCTICRILLGVAIDETMHVGTAGWDSVPQTLQPADPLWDGKGCGPTNTCCSFNNPPWFIKNLHSSTTDDVEMRLCKPYGDIGSTPIELVELYVQ